MRIFATARTALWWLLALGGLACCGLVAAAQREVLVDARPAVALWPAVTLLKDPGHRLDAGGAEALRAQFQRPEGTPGNLGRIADAVWLRVPLQVPREHPERRILMIDYPSLNRVEAYLVREGQIGPPVLLGNALRFDERPMPSRAHAATFDLPPGRSELLLRVVTLGTMVLPLSLHTAEDFVARESRAQMLQGVFFGLTLCLLAYSLVHWVTLRDRAFGWYAGLLAANIMFETSYFGIGVQYFWSGFPAFSQQVGPLSALVVVSFACLFVIDALAIGAIAAWAVRLLRLVALAAWVTVLLELAGWIDYRAAQALASALALVPLLAALPAAFLRMRQGDRAAACMLFGWAFYVVGSGTLFVLLRGWIEPGFWSQYLYPVSSVLQMAAWMGALALRMQAIERQAQTARVESEALRTLALTDALTGLPNRRGLHEQLAARLPHSTPRQLLAVYLLDLDGFKPVNDRHGHEVGDALLVAVGQRLRAQLRGSDVVARLGGDEFVVLASGLADEGAAQALGEKMLGAFHEPFAVAGHSCEVGLTIGYVVAPVDGRGAEELIQRADAAMYAGKRGGRRQLRRGGRAAALRAPEEAGASRGLTGAAPRSP